MEEEIFLLFIKECYSLAMIISSLEIGPNMIVFSQCARRAKMVMTKNKSYGLRLVHQIVILLKI